jgi:hypothetical protein
MQIGALGSRIENHDGKQQGQSVIRTFTYVRHTLLTRHTTAYAITLVIRHHGLNLKTSSRFLDRRP